MNWDAVGAIGEIVGAIAVVVTLIYLAKQIKQSVGMARASQNRTLLESYEGINDIVLSNTHIADALKAAENPDRGNDRPDSVIFRHLGYRWINVWVSAQMSFDNGQISKTEYEFYKDDFKNIVDLYPGMMPYVIEELRRYPSVARTEIFAPVWGNI
ncbi:MAG: hypothetical protein ACU84Q_21810 [Gammaproteobacteria bacterium]